MSALIWRMQMKSALNEWWRNLGGWPLAPHSFGTTPVLWIVLHKYFCLQPLPDTFVSKGYFLGSQSGRHIFFQIISVLPSNLGSTTATGECSLLSSSFPPRFFFFGITKSEYLQKSWFFFLFERTRQEEWINGNGNGKHGLGRCL